MSYSHIALGLWCTATLVLHATSARAESPDSGDSGVRREVAGHRFFPSLIVNDPFLSTYVGISTAAGYSWIDGPDFAARGDLVGGDRSYRAEAMAEGTTFQLGLTELVAVRLAGGGGIDGGDNAQSALVVGMIQPITAAVGGTVGWKLGSIARIGVTLDFVYAHTALIQPLVAVQSSLVAGEVQPSTVSEKLNSFSVLPGGAIAIAPSRSIGLLGSAQYTWAHVADGSSRSFNSLNLGASAQFDLKPDHGTPVGFVASYRGSISFESDVPFASTLEAGVFYTGRKELDLGLDFQLKWFDLRPDHRIRLDTTQLTGVVELRYHWN